MDNDALRFNEAKTRYDLIPYEWKKVLAEILTFGANKYSDRNWEKGMDWGKMIASAERHVVDFQSGQSYDRESGCHHLGHAAWNYLALMTYDLRRIGNSNLPHYIIKPTTVDLILQEHPHHQQEKDTGATHPSVSPDQTYPPHRPARASKHSA